MAPKFILYNISALILITLLWVSCKNKIDNPIPIPVWEDYDPDSATLTVTVQTQQGVFMVGSFVYLALNKDSLDKGILVRSASTNAVGRALFNRLYPRKYWAVCYARRDSLSLSGRFNIQLPPYAIRDTILTVH